MKELAEAKDIGISEGVLEALRHEAKKHEIRKLCLFGSRARGDYEEKSDIDLAVYGGQVSLFKLDIEDFVPTLLMFDVIDMDRSTSAELKENILKEGIVLYEED